MKNTVNYEKETEILIEFGADIDTEKFAILTLTAENLESVSVMVGSCVLHEIREKVNLKALCKQLKEQANDDVTVEEAELMLFSDLMKDMLFFRNKWLHEREKYTFYVADSGKKCGDRVYEILLSNNIYD